MSSKMHLKNGRSTGNGIRAKGDYFEGGGCDLVLTFDQMASAVP
jgi:hypothetical protein